MTLKRVPEPRRWQRQPEKKIDELGRWALGTCHAAIVVGAGECRARMAHKFWLWALALRAQSFVVGARATACGWMRERPGCWFWGGGVSHWNAARAVNAKCVYVPGKRGLLCFGKVLLQSGRPASHHAPPMTIVPQGWLLLLRALVRIFDSPIILPEEAPGGQALRRHSARRFV